MSYYFFFESAYGKISTTLVHATFKQRQSKKKQITSSLPGKSKKATFKTNNSTTSTKKECKKNQRFASLHTFDSQPTFVFKQDVTFLLFTTNSLYSFELRNSKVSAQGISEL